VNRSVHPARYSLRSHAGNTPASEYLPAPVISKAVATTIASVHIPSPRPDIETVLEMHQEDRSQHPEPPRCDSPGSRERAVRLFPAGGKIGKRICGDSVEQITCCFV
jgi:hypothetical protein